jgi:hypothetical protein
MTTGLSNRYEMTHTIMLQVSLLKMNWLDCMIKIGHLDHTTSHPNYTNGEQQASMTADHPTLVMLKPWAQM